MALSLFRFDLTRDGVAASESSDLIGDPSELIERVTAISGDVNQRVSSAARVHTSRIHTDFKLYPYSPSRLSPIFPGYASVDMDPSDAARGEEERQGPCESFDSSSPHRCFRGSFSSSPSFCFGATSVTAAPPVTSSSLSSSGPFGFRALAPSSSSAFGSLKPSLTFAAKPTAIAFGSKSNVNAFGAPSSGGGAFGPPVSSDLFGSGTSNVGTQKVVH
jgi:hypothetical protein